MRLSLRLRLRLSLSLRLSLRLRLLLPLLLLLLPHAADEGVVLRVKPTRTVATELATHLGQSEDRESKCVQGVPVCVGVWV